MTFFEEDIINTTEKYLRDLEKRAREANISFTCHTPKDLPPLNSYTMPLGWYDVFPIILEVRHQNMKIYLKICEAIL